MAQDSNPGKDKKFPLYENFRNAFGSQPASYSMGTGVISPSIAAGREADHSPSSIDEVSNEWSCTSTPFLRRHGVLKVNFTFYTILPLTL